MYFPNPCIHILQFVAATQPINSLSFVFDGVNFGASDFAYSAYSLVIISHLHLEFLGDFIFSDSFVAKTYYQRRPLSYCH